MRQLHVYNAGPLFTEAEQAQRRKEQTFFDDLNVKVFNPLTEPFNENVDSAAMIYKIDKEAIQQSNVFFFDLASNDPGTLVELGMVMQRIESGEHLQVYPVISDFRIYDRTNYKSAIFPVGYNSFVIGSLEYHKINIYKSFEEAFKQFVVDNKI